MLLQGITSRSIIFSATVIVVGSVATITLAYTSSQNVFAEREWGQVATARSLESLFGVLGFRAWLPQLAMLASTATCIVWWSHLRSRNGTNALVLALSVWIMARSSVFAMLWIADAPVTANFALLKPTFAAVPTGFWLCSLAMAASIASFVMAIRGIRGSGSVWVLLVAIPGIAMTFVWNLAYAGHTLPIDVWFTPLIFVWMLSRLRNQDVKNMNSLSEAKIYAWRLLQVNWIPAVLTSMTIVLSWTTDLLFDALRHNPEPTLYMAIKWAAVVVLCGLTYFATSKALGTNIKWEWIALMWLMGMYFVSDPAVERIPDEIPVLQSPVYLLSFWALLCAVPCLAFRKLTSYWPIGLALIWPGLILGIFNSALTLTDGTTRFIGIAGLLDLSLATGIFAGITYFVLGTAAHRRESPHHTNSR